MKAILAFLLAAGCLSAHAASPEVCRVIGDAVDNIVTARDAGVPEDIVLRAIDLGLKDSQYRAVMFDAVDIIYKSKAPGRVLHRAFDIGCAKSTN